MSVETDQTVTNVSLSERTSAVPDEAPGWDLSALDKLGADVEHLPMLAESRLNLREHSEVLQKKTTQMPSRWVPLVCLCCVFGLLVWASLAKIDQVTRGHGKVIPSSKVQTIQSLEEGIVIGVPVREGDIVENGQPVLYLDDTVAKANYTETASRRDLVIARMSRLQAEANGFEDPVYPDSIDSEISKIENELFFARRADYFARVSGVEQLLEHSRSQLSILLRGQKSMTKLDLIQAEIDVSTSERNLNTLVSETRRNALESHDSLRAELASLNSALVRYQDVLDRKILRSPTHGTVNSIQISGEGRVIGGGENLMEIVPINDSLLVEANIRPEDIGFIHSNQNATVKFTAYDYIIYGGISGVVEYIGVDTIMNEQGEIYYPVRIRTNSTTMGSKNGRELSIIPGMVAEVDILAGQKSVLQYLLTPLNRAREKALTEQ